MKEIILVADYKIKIIENALKELLEQNADITALISIGSFSQGCFDRFSDIDLYLVSNYVNKYTNHKNLAWAQCFGHIISKRIFRDSSQGVDKVKIITSNGIMFDITLLSDKRIGFLKKYLQIKKSIVQYLIPRYLKKLFDRNITQFYETIKRGYKIHHDSMNITPTITDISKQPESRFLLTRLIYDDHYNSFWQLCYTVSIKLIRGDFFFVVFLWDNMLKKELLWMIERSEKVKDDAKDVFYNGYKMKEWSQDVFPRLYSTLFSKDTLNMQQALLETIRIYQEISHDVASKLGFEVNTNLEIFIVDFIKKIAIPENEKQLPSL